MVRQKPLKAILEKIVRDVKIFALTDRDNMSDNGRREKINSSENFFIRILSRRSIENYLWDPDVLRTFLTSKKCNNIIVEEIINEWNNMISGNLEIAEIKKSVGKIYRTIRTKSNLPQLDNTYKDFAKYSLTNALQDTPSVYKQLRNDIFHPEKTI